MHDVTSSDSKRWMAVYLVFQGSFILCWMEEDRKTYSLRNKLQGDDLHLQLRRHIHMKRLEAEDKLLLSLARKTSSIAPVLSVAIHMHDTENDGMGNFFSTLCTISHLLHSLCLQCAIFLPDQWQFASASPTWQGKRLITSHMHIRKYELKTDIHASSC